MSLILIVPWIIQELQSFFGACAAALALLLGKQPKQKCLASAEWNLQGSA